MRQKKNKRDPGKLRGEYELTEFPHEQTMTSEECGKTAIMLNAFLFLFFILTNIHVLVFHENAFRFAIFYANLLPHVIRV